ncbi:MAG: hypothetical protein ACI36Z_10780 [Alloprevotella sp.]
MINKTILKQMPRENAREMHEKRGKTRQSYTFFPSSYTFFPSSYTQSYTRNLQILLGFSMPGVRNVVFFQKLFFVEMNDASHVYPGKYRTSVVSCP